MEKSIEELIKDLNNADELFVEETCAILQMRIDESFDKLIEALNSKKKNIRLNATKVLGMNGDSKAIGPLIDTLKDNNKLVRREASTALSRMGNEAVDPLINILAADDWRVRGAAAWVLGSLKDEKAIKPLEKLLDDESGFVKTGAKNALNSIKNS